jgi:hypothetical protein
MVRGRISSSIDDLNILNRQYNWIPNEYTIRPTQEDLEHKWALMDSIHCGWPSMKEYVWKEILKESKEEWVFEPSIFRYGIPKEANHWILWNTICDFTREFDENVINTVLEGFLEKNVDFAWYKNPKPSVPEYYHIQVFWIHLT